MVKKWSLISLLLLSVCLSWDWPTHQYAAREICAYTGCGDCLPYMLNGSIAPDRDFKDTINHHCYEPVQTCPAGNWTCPNRTDCPALEKAQEWLDIAGQDTGCNKAYDIGVASHYYLDSKVFWHTVSNEDYENCHAKFEHQVGLRIESEFNLSVCGIGITKADFEGYVNDFESRIGAQNSPVQGVIRTVANFINSLISAIIQFFGGLLKF
jgi:hypothetical protein